MSFSTQQCSLRKTCFLWQHLQIRSKMKALWATLAFNSKPSWSGKFKNNQTWGPKKSKNLLINRIYVAISSFYHIHISPLRQLLVWVCEEFISSKCSCQCQKSFMFWAEQTADIFCPQSPAPQSGAICDWLSSLWLPSHWTPRRGFDWLTVNTGSQRQDCIVPFRYHIPAWLLQHSWNNRRKRS